MIAHSFYPDKIKKAGVSEGFAPSDTPACEKIIYLIHKKTAPFLKFAAKSKRAQTYFVVALGNTQNISRYIYGLIHFRVHISV